MTRARLTIPALAYLVFSLAILYALFPVFKSGLAANRDITSTGTEYLLALVLPLAVLVIFSVLFRKATEGV